MQDLPAALDEQAHSGACAALGDACASLGFAAALDHCSRQSSTSEQFMRHFHQWFDGFRTLKLIHTLSRGDFPRQSLRQLGTSQPLLWPAVGTDIDRQLAHIRQHWLWR